MEKRKFQVNYFYATDDIHLNLIDYKTKHTLVRINLDSRFHNNSNRKVYGHRIEIFLKQEFVKKNDGVTQVKAYKLPMFGLRDTNDFIQALNEFLKYINVHSTDKIKISIEALLDI